MVAADTKSRSFAREVTLEHRRTEDDACARRLGISLIRKHQRMAVDDA